MSEKEKHVPGEGIRSLKTSNVFRVVNFELYTKPNAVIMGLGIFAITFSACYLGYMRYQYDQMGYYSAVQEDGTETFKKRKSKWNDD